MLFTKEKHVAYIGIGSNQGDRMMNCIRALEMLSAHKQMELIRVSRWFETEAMGERGPTGQPPFLNAAARVDTTLLAGEFLRALLDIETKLGRPPDRPKGSPRSIDLDLLLYDDLALHLEDMTIPHPELPKRLFVLVPLCDIAAEVAHPPSGLTIRELEVRCRSLGHPAWVNEWKPDDKK